MKTTDRHERISELFLAACEKPPGQRRAFVEKECAGDAELIAEVHALLAHDGGDLPSANGSDDVPVFIGHGANARISGHVDTSRYPTIDGYKITGVVGQGGMGIVYLAEQESPRRPVALKVIRIGLAAPNAVMRLEYEAEVLGRLNHSGIVKILEAGSADLGFGAQPYFAMEYVEGDTLLGFADKQKLDVSGRLAILSEVCRAVQHAHHRGIIHRDLKPGNVLVDADGHPKILDFGIARAVDRTSSDRAVLTMTGTPLGTIPYMSPEQVAGDAGDIDTRTDVYALGVIGYELLSGSRPHNLDGKTPLQALRVVADQPPTPLARHRRDLPTDADHIIRKAMARDRAERYQSSLEFADDIQRFLRNEPITARRASLAYRLWKFIGRHSRSIMVTAAILAVLAAGAGYQRFLSIARRVEQLMDDGNDAMQEKRYMAAAGFFGDALSLDPEDWKVLGNYSRLKKDMANAAETLEERGHQLEEAQRLCNRALEANGESAALWNLRGALQKMRGHYAGALSDYEQATTINPEFSAAWANIGQLRAKSGDLAIARSALMKAVNSSQAIPGAWRDLASVQLLGGDPEAIDSISMATTDQSEDEFDWLVSARIHLAVADPVGAQTAMEHASNARSFLRGARHEKVERMLALAHLRKEHFTDALARARSAINHRDLPTINHLIVAIAEASLGNADEAEDALALADQTWPAELSEPGGNVVTLDKGLLWIDTADELLALQNEARRLISAIPTD